MHQTSAEKGLNGRSSNSEAKFGNRNDKTTQHLTRCGISARISGFSLDWAIGIYRFGVGGEGAWRSRINCSENLID